MSKIKTMSKSQSIENPEPARVQPAIINPTGSVGASEPSLEPSLEPVKISLNDMLTMSCDDIKKASPTGQFSRLKLGLAIGAAAASADRVAAEKADKGLKAIAHCSTEPLEQASVSSQAAVPSELFDAAAHLFQEAKVEKRSLGLNDWLTLDSDELASFGVIQAD